MGLLKSFIKAVRKSKTIADERAVIQKELAAIRTLFRDPHLDQLARRTNIAKLMYLYIIGEKTHFGQVECIKLLALPLFADKRLGYLATMLILDENQEVLTLLTNLLDNDMQHPNAYIVGLALCCLGNIALPELARDLHANVEQILAKSTNGYLKKKAAIVAAKLVEKEPELCEYFAPQAAELVSDKSPSILMAALVLVQAIHAHGEDTQRQAMAALFPKLVAHLKRVNALGFMPDYDVGGVTDPFLQVLLLLTLRVLVALASQYMDQLNDLLTQVVLTLEALTKNAAHAVLYECVKTIFAIDADPALKILGVNLLGKFLATRDNNCRYVALDALLTVIQLEPQAVQRHRQTIVDCLGDGDVLIRRRALELTFAIVNELNIRVLAREVLAFLGNCTDGDLCTYVTGQLTVAAAKYAPNDKWHFDTVVRMLKLAGNHVAPDIVSQILALILQCQQPLVVEYVVGKVWAATVADPKQYGLCLVAMWCIGEYGEMVIGKTVGGDGEKDESDKELTAVTITENSIIDVFHAVLANLTFSEAETTQVTAYILTAAIKLSVKFRKLDAIEELRLILSSKSYDANIEIQTRALEYQQIFGLDAALKQGLVAHMPPPPVKAREALALNASTKRKPAHTARPATPATTEDLLLDLIDNGNDNFAGTPSAPATNDNDLLSDIFGSGLAPVSSPAPAASLPAPVANAVAAFSNPTFLVLFVPQAFGGGKGTAEAVVEPAPGSPATVSKVQLLIAVPKLQKLVISLTLGDRLPVRQTLNISGNAGAKVKLRVKVRYDVDGDAREDQFDFAGFPQTL